MLKIYGMKQLTASRDTRTISGLLLPFGEHGYTNKGRVLASKGTLTIDTSKDVFLNVEHERARRIGKATSISEQTDGIHASFTISATSAGDDALTEIEDGLRCSLSIEIDDPVIRKGQLTAGMITGAALVAEPAFPSAVLTCSAPDQGTPRKNKDDEKEEDDNETAEQETQKEEDQESTSEPEDSEESEEEKKKEKKPMNASRVTQIGGLSTASKKTVKHDKEWLLANLAGQTRDNRLAAALSDVVPADILGQEQPQYVGELWDGRAYERKIIPLLTHADLTSFKVQGWRWKTKPTVGAWEGNKKDIPSGKVETEAVELDAKRIAGGHDIDRKFRDFPNQEFWEAYFAAMTESYARISDTAVLTELKTAATTVTAGTKPANIAQGIVNIVDGALSIMNETDTVPTSAVVATDLWRDIMLTPQEHVLGYLSAAMSLEDGTLGAFPIIPSAALGKGETLVLTKSAATVHELAGSPIRVEALDISRGGVDSAIYGYYALNVHDKGGLALVTATGAAA